MSLATLPPLPLATSELRSGLSAGRLDVDPAFFRSRRGRLRRWMYAAAGNEERSVGAAVVDLGFVGTAFVWAVLDGDVVTWERTRPLGRGCTVGPVPTAGAEVEQRRRRPHAEQGGRDTVALGGDGSLTIDVRPEGSHRRLHAALTAGPVTPAVLVTETPRGGWNVTEKAAGYAIGGHLGWADATATFAGSGWRDWTTGRQDRHTHWRWVAGAGTTARNGRSRVGINVSTGMNAAGAGEDVVWWDGEPYGLDVSTVAPSGDDPAGSWVVTGPGWRLDLEPVGARAADENLLVVSSRYVQPVGRIVGTLPSPDGDRVEVALTGVAEHHEARW